MGLITYVAFLMAIINTLILSYELAIKKYFFNSYFQSLEQFLIFSLFLLIPIMTLIGFIHMKKSRAFSSEMDIRIESNPHMRKMLLNTESQILLQSKQTELLFKKLKNLRINDEDKRELSTLCVKSLNIFELKTLQESKLFDENLNELKRNYVDEKNE